MAARPKSVIAGPGPLPDLPFLDQPAFIWDHARCAVTWMNGAARSKFGLTAQELQAALPASLLRQFERRAKGSGSRRASVKLTLPRRPAVDFCLEPIELAGGHRGLVAVELLPDTVSAPESPQKLDAKRPGKARRAVTSAKEPDDCRASTPQLTPAELRAFKSIGRKVRRLVQEKQRAPVPPKRQAETRPLEDGPSLGIEAASEVLRSAFDLVLFLGENFCILKCEGRPQRIGWRKLALIGKPAAQLLPLSEQAVFARIGKKVTVDGAQICRDSFMVCGESGAATPCRLILGRWPGGDARYFLALVSLSLPPRLKRLQARADLPLQQTRLAA